MNHLGIVMNAFIISSEGKGAQLLLAAGNAQHIIDNLAGHVYAG